MTEQEAMDRIKYRISTASEIVGTGENGNAFEDFNMAIKALEEVEQYRAIGTPEECKAAVEKHIPKKIIKYADGTEHCPTCDCDNSCIGYGVCIDCGQKLDWRDEE